MVVIRRQLVRRRSRTQAATDDYQTTPSAARLKCLQPLMAGRHDAGRPLVHIRQILLPSIIIPGGPVSSAMLPAFELAHHPAGMRGALFRAHARQVPLSSWRHAVTLTSTGERPDRALPTQTHPIPSPDTGSARLTGATDTRDGGISSSARVLGRDDHLEILRRKHASRMAPKTRLCMRASGITASRLTAAGAAGRRPLLKPRTAAATLHERPREHEASEKILTTVAGLIWSMVSQIHSSQLGSW